MLGGAMAVDSWQPRELLEVELWVADSFARALFPKTMMGLVSVSALHYWQVIVVDRLDGGVFCPLVELVYFPDLDL